MREVEVLGVRAQVAESFPERALGLIGRPPPAPGCGLLIPHCNCVHTLFMRYPIDVTFLDGHGEVVRKISNVRPWRLFVWGGWRARTVLETFHHGFHDCEAAWSPLGSVEDTKAKCAGRSAAEFSYSPTQLGKL